MPSPGIMIYRCTGPSGPPLFWVAPLSDGIHPPGYYLLLHGAVALFGYSEFALRFPSILAGSLAVPLICQLGCILGTQRWGWSLAYCLLSIPLPGGTQKARMYSLLLCLSVAVAYSSWKLVARADPRRWLWLTVASALSFGVYYYAMVFNLVQSSYLIASLRRTHRVLHRCVSAQAVAFLTFLPRAVTILTRKGRDFRIGWIHRTPRLDLPLTLCDLALAPGGSGRPRTSARLALMVGAVGLGWPPR